MVPIDLAPEQRLRLHLLQEFLDHLTDVSAALNAAQQAEAWVLGRIGEVAEISLRAMVRAEIAAVVGKGLPKATASAPSAPSPVSAAISIPAAIQPAAEAAKPHSHDEAAQPEARGDDATIKRLAADGWTYAAIASDIGKSDGYVRSRAAELGIPPRQSGPVTVKPGLSLKQIERETSAKTRRAELKRMWEEGVPAGDIAKKLGYAGAASVRATAVNHMGLTPRAPEVLSSEAIAQHIAEKGVLTEPDFGDAAINELYRSLRMRGHTLTKAPPNMPGPRRFILDGGAPITRAELLSRGKAIGDKERPLADICGGVA